MNQAKSDEPFKVSRRYAGTPYGLVHAAQSAGLLRNWYQTLTPFIKAVGYGLFAHTNQESPGEWQTVTAGELLEIIESSRHLTRTETLAFHGQHYQDIFEALERLFNVAVPFKTKSIRKSGRRWKAETRIGSVRLLQGLQLIYCDKGGQTVDLNDPRNEEYVVNINRRYAGNLRSKNRQNNGLQSESLPVFALARLDAQGQKKIGLGGKEQIQPPSAYAFRWGSDIIEDLTDSRKGGKGCGYLRVCRAVFGLLKRLRKGNHLYAARLLDLIISDIIAGGIRRQELTKTAKLIFQAAGLPNPGDCRKGHLREKDGRWAENVATIASAVRVLKDEGVLLPESDECPIIGFHGTKAPSYRWKRADDWTFTKAVDTPLTVETRLTECRSGLECYT